MSGFLGGGGWMQGAGGLCRDVVAGGKRGEGVFQGGRGVSGGEGAGR